MTAGIPAESSAPAEGGASADIFLTVDQLMEQAHLALDAVPEPSTLEIDTMSLLAGASPPDDETIGRIRRVIDKGRRTGRILDSFEERRAAQKELDYLAKILERFGLSFQETTLVPFDPDALRNVAVPAYPFEDALEQQRTTPVPSREQLHDYLWRHMDGADLRCDRAVLDGVTSQLAGDPEAWTLLDFTLRRMYAELERIGAGNKLQWPKGIATDSRTLLAETARQSYEACPKADQETLRKILVKLGMHARRHTGRRDFDEFDGIEIVEGGSAKRVLAMLEEQDLVRSTGPVTGKRRWKFVHRSLQERWSELQRWVDSEQTARRQRLSLVFWTSFVIALLAVGTAAGLGLYKQQLLKADALAGAANVRLSSVQGSDPKTDNALLNDVQRAYRVAPTPIAYVTLFNAVNRIAHLRAPVSAQIMNSYITTFAAKPGDPPIKLSIPAQQDFIPGDLTGSPVATAFSPSFAWVAIVHKPRPDSDEAWLNIYRWGAEHPVWSGPPCPDHESRGTIRLSTAGRYFAIECASATDSAVGGVDPDDDRRLKQMLATVGAEKLAEERFPYFSGEGSGEVHMITVSIAGELKVRPLDGHDEQETLFRIPLLAAITPMDTSYDHRGQRIAVLDRQGVVAIYGRPHWFTRYINPIDEAPAILYINANDSSTDSKDLTWQPIGVEFQDSGKCLRVRRMALDRDMVKNGFIQHYWDEWYVIDPDRLLEIASRLTKGEVFNRLPCSSESPS
ncbi:MAG: hypothetical protein ABI794_12090 [Betaproteobacteria bacterium]